MTKKKQNLIEGLGLLLILLSFLIQLIETDIESEIREAQFYQTQKKLDNIWILTSKDYSEKHPELNVHSGINFEGIVKNWSHYSEDKKYLDNWKDSVYFKGISNSRIWIFIIGSILILIPKFTKQK
jgi:hypothetical protein